MNHKVGAFCELVKFLHEDHLRWTRDPTADRKQRLLNEEVGQFYRVIEKRNLERGLAEARSGRSFLLDQQEGFLFLKPPEKDRVLLPVLSLNTDFSKPHLQVRMAIFTLDENDEPAAIGFRFEKGEKRHKYHHAQMIQALQPGGKRLPGVPKWLPERQPALLMSARSPFSLFLGILMSLYGLDYLEKAWPGHICRQHLQQDLADLRKGCGV